MLYRGMDRAQLGLAYNNTAAVPERSAIVADWAARSARVRRERADHLDLVYGDSPRERLDLFLAPNRRAPTLTFVHGGYWQMNDKENFAFLAEGLLLLGINLAVVEYTLARQHGLTASSQRCAPQYNGSPGISAITVPIRRGFTPRAIRLAANLPQ
jgi:arylformamidase